jgi:hypothetical protein
VWLPAPRSGDSVTASRTLAGYKLASDAKGQRDMKSRSRALGARRLHRQIMELLVDLDLLVSKTAESGPHADLANGHDPIASGTRELHSLLRPIQARMNGESFQTHLSQLDNG